MYCEVDSVHKCTVKWTAYTVNTENCFLNVSDKVLPKPQFLICEFSLSRNITESLKFFGTLCIIISSIRIRRRKINDRSNILLMLVIYSSTNTL